MKNLLFLAGLLASAGTNVQHEHHMPLLTNRNPCMQIGMLTELRLPPYPFCHRLKNGWVNATLDETIYGHDAIFPVHAFIAGVNYDLLYINKIT